VLADTAVLIADGGRVLSDLATLRDQSKLYGLVASDPTLWRTLHEIGPTSATVSPPLGRAAGEVVASEHNPVIG
jgi:hypothetical protein